MAGQYQRMALGATSDRSRRTPDPRHFLKETATRTVFRWERRNPILPATNSGTAITSPMHYTPGREHANGREAAKRYLGGRICLRAQRLASTRVLLGNPRLHELDLLRR